MKSLRLIALLALSSALAAANASGSAVAPSPSTTPAGKPLVVSGYGSRVLTVMLARSGPLVVRGTHNGQGIFVVDLITASGRDYNLYRALGPYQGETVWAQAGRGAYRVRVNTDGGWTLRFEQPGAAPRAPRLPGVLNGRGAHVVQVWVPRSFEPVISGWHHGAAAFSVDLVSLDGSKLGLLSGFSDFRGPKTLRRISAGAYLVVVTADGQWQLAFTRKSPPAQ